MDVLINHCWCSDSNWGGNYDCRVIVSIRRIPSGKTYYDPPETDWLTLLTKHDLEVKEFGDEPYTMRLNDEVIQWLLTHVKDRSKGIAGWAIGTDRYNSKDRLGFNVFFQSYRDAAKFIKRWSSYGKPVDYLNYFRDLRRQLDFKTNRLKRVTK